jgi:hypothetical protein
MEMEMKNESGEIWGVAGKGKLWVSSASLYFAVGLRRKVANSIQGRFSLVKPPPMDGPVYRSRI